MSPFGPKSTPSGWRSGEAPLLRPVPAREDPELAKRIDLGKARELIATIEADAKDARAAGATVLADHLDRVIQQQKAIFDKIRLDLPTPVAADRLRDAAMRDLQRAAEELAAGTTDRDESRRRQEEVEYLRGVLTVRTQEWEDAVSRAGYPWRKLSDAFTNDSWTSARSVAVRLVEDAVAKARQGRLSEAIFEPTTPEGEQWERVALWRQMQAYEPDGEALTRESIGAAFAARWDPEASRRAWIAQQVKAAKKREVKP